MNISRQKMIVLFLLFYVMNSLHAQQPHYVQQQTANGIVEGVVSPGRKSANI